MPTTIPGVSDVTAQVMVAEIGVDEIGAAYFMLRDGVEYQDLGSAITSTTMTKPKPFADSSSASPTSDATSSQPLIRRSAS